MAADIQRITHRDCGHQWTHEGFLNPESLLCPGCGHDRGRAEFNVVFVAEEARPTMDVVGTLASVAFRVPVWFVVGTAEETQQAVNAGVPADQVLRVAQLDEALAQANRVTLLTAEAARKLVDRPVGKTNLFWDLVHNCIVHPLLGIFRYSRRVERWHTYTAAKAWPSE